MNRRPISLYTIKLDELQIEKLGEWLKFHRWESYAVEYAHFAYRSKAANVVAYRTGKVVIQGKETEDFVKYTLEPEITQRYSLGYEEVDHPEWFRPHGGIDESGKGDLFGPLISATVVADGEMVRSWISSGIRDSKLIKSDKQILDCEQTIRRTKGVVVEVFSLGMAKYNELYARFGANMNRLLAWYHAKSLENALSHWPVDYVLLDQFTKKPLVQEYFKTSPVTIDMRTKAESDPVVAAASIVARAEYIRRLKTLSETAGERLLRGASASVLDQARRLVQSMGPSRLPEFAKMHFSTATRALAQK